MRLLNLFQRFSLIFLLFFSSIAFADELIIEPDAGRAPLLSAIAKAQHEIDLVVYGFTDEAFLQALINAKKSGKEIHVLLEDSPYKNQHENDMTKTRLQNAGIDVVSGNPTYKYTHQKTFILDQARAIVMTFNLTHATFKHERNFALIITDPEKIKEITNVFHADFLKPGLPRPNATRARNDEFLSDLIWSPANSRSNIISALKNAHSQIDIYAENLNDYKIIGVLGALARQGIKIRILHSTESTQTKKFRYLKKSGVQLTTSKKYLIHAKVIIIDNQLAILGSTNLTKNSLDHNRELSILTRDPKIISSLENTFEQDWAETKSRHQVGLNHGQSVEQLLMNVTKTRIAHDHHMVVWAYD